MSTIRLNFITAVSTGVMLLLRFIKANRVLMPTSAPLRSERGQAMIELALITPIIFVIWFGVVDLGSVIEQRMTLARIVNEATRMSASMTNLKPTPPQTSKRSATAVTTEDPNQARIAERVQLLLDIETKEGRLKLNPNTINIKTNYENSSSNTVKIQIDAHFQSSFTFASFFSSFPVSVSDTTAYLY